MWLCGIFCVKIWFSTWGAVLQCITRELGNLRPISIWDVKEPLRMTITLAVTILIASIERLIWCKYSEKRLTTQRIVKVKASSYIAQYPVLRTAQSALHFTSLTDLFTLTPSRLFWEASSHMLQLMREGCLYTYPPLSIARYSFI